MAQGNFFRTLRISILLVVLVFVALGAWLAKLRSTDWNDTLWVALYPINGDGSEVSRHHIEGLSADEFAAVEDFMAAEAARYGVDIARPVHTILGARLTEEPPQPPADGAVLKVIWWSLRLRFWASRQEPGYDGPDPDIQVFVVYHDPDKTERVAHSLGLEKGLIGVVNAWAGPREAAGNNVVIAHELLHTLGASDKYDPQTSLPVHPAGYAEPQRSPLFPQIKAEIMGGRIPLSATKAKMPANLKSTLVGPETAAEIRWRAEQ